MRGENFKLKRICFVIFVFLFFSFSIVFSSALSGNLSAEIDAGIVVNYSDFKKGASTTQLLYFDDDALTRIEELTLEKPYEGKIIFPDSVNLAQDAVDNYIGVSENVKVSYNYVRVNSSALTSLGRPALIYFYDLIYGTPQVLRNGEVCPDSICSIISYDRGNLVFRVEGFSEYSVREFRPEDEEEDEADSGGDSGGGSEGEVSPVDNTFPDFFVSSRAVSVNLNRGELFRKKITLVNNGTEDLNIAVDIKKFGQFIYPSERFFDLSVGERKELTLEFYFPKRMLADIYVGNITFLSTGVSRDLNVILNLNDDSLFDVRTSVVKDQYMSFEKIKGNITLISLGDDPTNATLTYSILDYDGNVFSSISEDIYINHSLTLSREIYLPRNIEPGNYLFYVEIDSGTSSAFSSDSFLVVDKSLSSFIDYLGTEEATLVMFIFIFINLLIIIFVYYLIRERRKLRKFSYDYR